LAWPCWSKKFEIELKEENVLMIDNYQGVMEGVTQNLGIAMGYFPMLNASTASEAIVPVFPNKQCEFGNIYLVYKKTNQHKTEIIAFKKWLTSMIARDNKTTF